MKGATKARFRCLVRVTPIWAPCCPRPAKPGLDLQLFLVRRCLVVLGGAWGAFGSIGHFETLRGSQRASELMITLGSTGTTQAALKQKPSPTLSFFRLSTLRKYKHHLAAEWSRQQHVQQRDDKHVAGSQKIRVDCFRMLGLPGCLFR